MERNTAAVAPIEHGTEKKKTFPFPENWKKLGVSATLQVAKYVGEQQKAVLTKAEFYKKMLRELGLSTSSVNRLLAIYKHPVVNDPKYLDKLPKTWTLLYELSLTPTDDLIKELEKRSLVDASRINIWELRKNKKLRSRGGSGGKVSALPEGMTITEYVKSGIAREEGRQIDAVAKSLGLDHVTYRMIRALILLEKETVLTEKERMAVIGALAEINRTRNVRRYYNPLRGLVDKVWGETQKNREISAQSAQKRRMAFLDAIDVIAGACGQAHRLELPPLAVEEQEKALSELDTARASLRSLMHHIRRSG